MFKSLNKESKLYSVYWGSQLCGAIGTKIQSLSFAWFIYTITDSMIALTMFTLAETLPSLIMSLPSGTLVDKYRKINIFKITQIIRVCVISIFLTLMYCENINIEWVILYQFIECIIVAVYVPSDMIILNGLSKHTSIGNRLNSNSIIGAISSTIGPIIAGIVIQNYDIKICLTIYLVCRIPLLIFSLYTNNIYTNNASENSDCGEKLSIINYLKDNLKIVYYILSMIVVGLFITNFNLMIPVVSKDILHRNALDFSIFYTAMGIGNFIGNYIYSRKIKMKRYNDILSTVSIIILGFILTMIGLSDTYILTLALFILLGAMNQFIQIDIRAEIQESSPDEIRGRVTGVYQLVSLGIGPIAKIEFTAILVLVNPRLGLIIQGLLSIFFVVILYKVYNKSKINNTEMEKV